MVHGAVGSASKRNGLRLLRSDRLRKRFEFGRVRDQGRRVYTKCFVVVLRRRDDSADQDGGEARLGLTVSQKVGGAVRRNRVKRLVREVFRQHRQLFPAGADVVVIAKAGCAAESFEQVRSELGQAARAMQAALPTGLRSRAEPRASTDSSSSLARGTARFDKRSR